MPIQDLVSRGQPRLLKGQAAITNMKGEYERRIRNGGYRRDYRPEVVLRLGNVVGPRLFRRGLLRGRMRC
jgi:hypothetical protein